MALHIFPYFALTLFSEYYKTLKKHTTKTYEGLEVQLHSFLTSGPDACTWLVSCHSCFTAGKKPQIFFDQERSLERTKSHSRNFGKQRKISCPCWKSHRDYSVTCILIFQHNYMSLFKNSYMFMS
jgi:hypothetical protein